MTRHPPSRVYSFVGFTLDAGRRLLSSRLDGQPVPLPNTAFDAPLYLVEHAGELIEKTTLMRMVWPHVTVEENSLSQSISVLRRALGEAPSEHRFIATVPGRGYRFIAQVTTKGADGQRAEPTMASSDPDAFQLYVTGWWALTRPGGGNLEDALRHLEQAVARDPNFALAHVCIADCCTMLGVHAVRSPHEIFPRAREAALRALEIEPDLAEAHAQLELTLKMDGSFDVARNFLGRSFLRLGAFERAIEQFEGRTTSTFGSAADLATVYALSGRVGEAKTVLDGLVRRAGSRYVSPTDIATIHAALEDDEAALDCLEQSVEQRAFDFIKVNPAFRPVARATEVPASHRAVWFWVLPVAVWGTSMALTNSSESETHPYSAWISSRDAS